jgi:hypothetical protein
MDLVYFGQKQETWFWGAENLGDQSALIVVLVNIFCSKSDGFKRTSCPYLLYPPQPSFSPSPLP